MQLFSSPASPFGRKVKVAAHELDLLGRIEINNASLSPIAPHEGVSAANPLGKIPCLITDEGEPLFDSRVIIEYLDSLHGGTSLFPAHGPARWRALTQQALGDGIMDAAVANRYETVLRPEDLRWPEWSQGLMLKVTRGLARLEEMADSLSSTPDIGVLTIACALGYLDFRYADRSWRSGHPKLAAWFEPFSQRPSMQATVPHA
jgi:glutathione S-transferase